jgi:hypothetical protein
MPSTRTRDARVLDVETHPFSDVDAATAALSAGTSFVAACQNGTLPNVCYIDPAFDNEGNAAGCSTWAMATTASALRGPGVTSS